MPETATSTLILPTVHLNGTSARDLLDQHVDAMHALSEALEKLPHPNGRDYYPQGLGVIQDAMRQRERWAKLILEVQGEIEEIAEHISDLEAAAASRRY